MTSCHTCSGDVQENELFCPACGAFDGYPNVKMAQAERARLEERFRSLDDAIRTDPVLREVASTTDAVVNVSLDYAAWFLRSEGSSFAAYRKLVESGIRRPALPEHDKERMAAEGEAFGSAASIFYAAL